MADTHHLATGLKFKLPVDVFPLERSPSSSLPPIKDPPAYHTFPPVPLPRKLPPSSSCPLSSQGFGNLTPSPTPPSPPTPPPSPRCCMRPPCAFFASVDAGPLHLRRRKRQKNTTACIKDKRSDKKENRLGIYNTSQKAWGRLWCI